MLNVFNPPVMGTRTPVVFPMYSYVVSCLNRELLKVKQYYENNLYVVPNNHRLVKLIIDLQTYMQSSPEMIARLVVNESDRLCRAYGITSSVINGGISTAGDMYNRNSPEVFISIEESINIKAVYDNFRDQEPVRVLTHDFTDLEFGLANGKYSGSERGIAVFGINLPLLAVQYKAWYDKERYVKETDTYLPTHYFVVKYILRNMISSHVDIAMFNRLLALLHNQYIPNGVNHHSFLIADHSAKLDQTHEQLLQRLKNTQTDYIQRLESLPSLEHGSYLRTVTIPDVAPTRQIKWAMVLSRLKTIEYLLTIDRISNGQAINQMDRETIARELRVLRSDRALTMYLPEPTMNRINNIYAIVSRE